MKLVEDIVIPSIREMAVSVSKSVIKEILANVTSSIYSPLTVYQFDSIYRKLNLTLYKLDPAQYDKNKFPYADKSVYELKEDVAYIIRFTNVDLLIVQTFLERREGARWRYIKLTFIGAHTSYYKNKFYNLVSNAKGEDIELISLGYDSTVKLKKYDFSKIILDKKVKDTIVRGIYNWKNSKDWYTNASLKHKLGILLYGNPGTGKSSLATAISSMLNNAPIITIRYNSIYRSIESIAEIRASTSGVIIVLLEDIDMIFKSRSTPTKGSNIANYTDSNWVT